MAAAVGIAAGIPLASIFAAEGAVHIWRRPEPDAREADAVVRACGGSWRPARITAPDGTRLDGWFFRPARSNGSAVILLHGISDTRAGVLDAAEFLLRAGYTVLTPDARGHGASGGDPITYGVREASDVHAWADWLVAQGGADRLYGLGRSLGAAILLESLPREPRFRAVVAEAPFAEFREIAEYRLAQNSGAPAVLFWPVVRLGFLYGRLRYGVDLGHASPEAALRSSTVPVLLIHGTEDQNIPVQHSRELHAANPRTTELWEIPGGHHLDLDAQAGAEYESRVLGWFAAH